MNETQKDNFETIISGEFGLDAPSYSEKDKSKNRSLFKEVAGEVEDLIMEKFGEDSDVYLHLHEALEKWE